MGFLWTTEGTRRVLDTLNNAFDATGSPTFAARWKADSQLAQYIRDRAMAAGPPGVGPQAHACGSALGRARRRDGNDQRRHRKRWHWFLQDMASKSPATFTAIQNALSDGILTKDAQTVM
jgi:hypothetical protein